MLEKQREMGDLIEQIEQDHIQLRNSQDLKSRFKKSEEEAKAKMSAIQSIQKLENIVNLIKIQFKDRLGIKDLKVAPEEE